MIYKLMSVNDIQYLYGKVGHLTVKFPKSNKEFFCQGDLFTANNRVRLFQSGSGHEVHTSAQELLVEMTYQTYQLRRLQDDADYELALAVFKQYFDAPLDSEEGRFAYLLSLIIADYEAEHYPIAVSSTVDFVNTLLKERQQTWRELQTGLCIRTYHSVNYLKTMLEPENLKVELVIKLSRWFCLPVQAFIVGGYGD